MSKTTVRVDDLGDGARQAIITAAILLSLKRTAVLLEDPEVHQHPGGLTHLMDFVLKVAKERGHQLFITTHSIELVGMVSKLCEEHDIKWKIYYLERDSDGIVDVRELEKIDLEVCRKIGLDPRFLYML